MPLPLALFMLTVAICPSAAYGFYYLNSIAKDIQDILDAQSRSSK